MHNTATRYSSRRKRWRHDPTSPFPWRAESTMWTRSVGLQLRFMAAGKALSRLGGLCILFCMIMLNVQYKSIPDLTCCTKIFHVKNRGIGRSTALMLDHLYIHYSPLASLYLTHTFRGNLYTRGVRAL